MKAKPRLSSPMNKGAPQRRLFTVELANRAVPLVARIVFDIRREARALVALDEDSKGPCDDRETRDDRSRQVVVQRLFELTQEFSSVGCELKDIEAGLVDFPAMHEGREICLCWKLGESQVNWWHETTTGFPGRRPIQDGSPV